MKFRHGRHLLITLMLCLSAGALHPGIASARDLDTLENYATLAEQSVLNMELVAEPPDLDIVSSECMADLLALTSNSSTDQTVQVLDSFGKPASGVLAGNLAWLGHFDQCMAIEEFRHCLVGIGANLTEVLGTPVVLPIRWGVCMPQSCSEEDVRNAMEMLLDFLEVEWITINNIQGSAVYCTEKSKSNFDAGFIATCTLISLLAALSLLGSVVDYCHGSRDSRMSLLLSEENNADHQEGRGTLSNDDEKENLYEELNPENNEDSEINNSPIKTATEKSPLLARKTIPEDTVLSMVIQHDTRPSVFVRLLLCFALSRNLPKILSTKQAAGGVPCLNGLRVISISWVILGHTLIFTNYSFASDNLLMALDRWLDNILFQAIFNAYSAVDTFFFLSGFLLTYLVLKKLKESNGKLPWGWFYLHRYLRLTPSLGLLILVLVFIFPTLNQGPVWLLGTFTTQFCSDWWWTDLLYLNNLVPDGKKDCIAWAWYLANDMQFFILSPLLILPLFWFPAIGIGALIVTCLASFVTTAILVYVNDFHAGEFATIAGIFGNTAIGSAQGNFHSVVYVKPYCRIPPYLVGMAMGYAMYRIGTRKVRMSPVLVSAGWAVASALGIAVIYGLYDSNRGASIPSTAASMAYNSLAPFVWAVAISWVVFACHYGYGGFINSFLSWSFWVPLSRLTYTVYLFHPIVMYVYGYSLAVPFHWSAVTLLYLFVSYLVLAHAVAMCVALLLEFPVGSLEKMLQQAVGKD